MRFYADTAYNELRPHFQERIHRHEPLARHCTFGVGGQADVWVSLEKREELVDLLAAFLFPDFGKEIHGFVTIQSAIAEIWMLGYLLVIGVKTQKPGERILVNDPKSGMGAENRAGPLLVYSILTGTAILVIFLVTSSRGMLTSVGVEAFFAIIIVVSLILRGLYIREVK